MFSTTKLLSSTDSCMVENFTYEPAANEISRSKSNCENLCNNDGNIPLDCMKPALTVDHFKYWSYLNWALLGICIAEIIIGEYNKNTVKTLICSALFEYFDRFLMEDLSSRVKRQSY